MTYQFGFALTTALGNKTRYINLKKYAKRDKECECIWSPIKHYLDPDPYQKYPKVLHENLILRREASAILQQWENLDAVVVHAFHLFSFLTLYRPLRKRPLLVLYQDYAPFRDVEMLRNYGKDVEDNWRRKLRYQLEVWFARKADLNMPWSEWAKNVFMNECHVPEENIHIINVSIDLELWPYIEKTSDISAKPHILFVGGAFKRKGGDILLDVFLKHFSDVAILDLVTKEAPAVSHKNVRIYTDMVPNDPRLQELYAQCDIFTLPTKGDMSPIVSVEAMATGRPVISTNVGGIPDMVKDGKNGFLIEPNNPDMLRERLQLLLDKPQLRYEMGQEGRRFVEKNCSAERGTALMLSLLKEAVDKRAKN